MTATTSHRTIPAWFALALAPALLAIVPVAPEQAPTDDAACVEVPMATKCAAWTAVYDNPDAHEVAGMERANAIAVSPDSGRTYQVGATYQHACEGATTLCGDVATVAYDADGAQVWEAIHAGPANLHDTGQDVAVSPDGSQVYVVGTQDYHPSGSRGSFLAIAYDAATGAQLWTARWDEPSADESWGGAAAAAWGNSVAVSPDGAQVYVSGWSYGRDTQDMDYTTAAYDAATGTLLWHARADGVGGTDWQVDLAVSPAGDRVYVGGTSSGDYLTIAYNTAPPERPDDAALGAELWRARYDDDVRGANLGALTASPDGSRVLVTGRAREADGYQLSATAAYDAATGEQLWAHKYGPVWGTGQHLAVSPDGQRLYVTGDVGQVGVPRTSATPTVGYHSDYGTVAYDVASGDLLWEARFGLHEWDHADAVAVSPDGGTVYVTGSSVRANYRARDIATVAYDAATGEQRWVALFNSSPARVDDNQAGDLEKPAVLSPSADGIRLYVSATLAYLNPVPAAPGQNREDFGLLAYDVGGA